jgi:D-alanyl-D-alanine carboxypeptidase (penicillin-binding protein 5/6)
MDAPSIRAKSAIMIDAQSGKTLYEKNADERLSVASTQKLLTAMEVIAEGGLEQDVQVTIWDQLQPPTKLGLIAGTSHRRLDLLGAMLVSSANDAASALANAADGSYGDFISRMNARADRLGAKHSLFLNPHGLDMPGQHSTARDAAIIAYHAYRVPLIRHFAAQEMIPFSYGDGRTILLENTNILLWNRPAYFNGLKSGFTIEGGKCLVASAKHRGREILIVLLASTQEEVFRDAKRLFRWYEKQVKTNATGDAPPAR